MRIACLLVPDLPLRAELRASPELNDQTLVITDGPGSRAEVLTASPKALSKGVHRGLTLPQARALARDLVVRVASPVLERAARDTLMDIALSLAPRAELSPRSAGLFVSEGTVYVDASGIDALHASERMFASVLLARAEQAGLPGVVALASSRSISRLAARHLAFSSFVSSSIKSSEAIERPEASSSERIQVLSTEEEPAFLAPLPIDLLDPNDRTAEALTRFGVHRIRDLLRLPRRDLAARLGPGILDLVGRARGEEVETPLLAPKNLCLEEGFDLEEPIASLEPLAFVLRGLVSRLAERLRLRSLGSAALRLEMSLENGARESRRIGLASVTQDERVQLRLLRLEIESNPPGAAIESVLLSCEGLPLRREQLDFFRPRGPSPSALDETLAELSALCGPERVGTPALLDEHRPDAFALRPFAPDPFVPLSTRDPKIATRNPRTTKRDPKPTEGSKARSGSLGGQGRRRATGRTQPLSRAKFSRSSQQTSGNDSRRPRVLSGSPRLTLRVFRPPLRAEVRTEAGRPIFIRSAVSQGKVLQSAGPWRTTGGWWSKSAHFAVDHYDLQISDGIVLRLCFDWKQKWWQVDGLYD